jgi:hypothetical protein
MISSYGTAKVIFVIMRLLGHSVLSFVCHKFVFSVQVLRMIPAKRKNVRKVLISLIGSADTT